MKFKIGDRVARVWNDGTVKVGEIVDISSKSYKEQSIPYYRVSFGVGSSETFLGYELKYIEDYTQTIQIREPPKPLSFVYKGDDHIQTIKSTEPSPVRYISIGSSEDPRPFELESSMWEIPTKVYDEMFTEATKPTGGSSEYYDFNPEWETLNDLMDEKAEYQWKEHTHYLHNIMKAAFRWGAKNGTSKGYDARKIVYYALRILRSLEGREAVQKELKSLIEDKQFLEYNDVIDIDGDE